MKDPYLKPIILGGFLTALITIIFAPAIFLWATVGGYITSRLAFKITKETINNKEGILLGLMSGIVSGSLIDLFTVISLNLPDNHKLLTRVLEKKLPSDILLSQSINEVLPSIITMTCLLVILITIVFSIFGAYIGIVISNKSKKVSN